VADPIAPGGERVKVLDFGIAKLTSPLEAGGVKTDSLAIMGTPRYMSPEQCKGAGGVDDKTDVYSLGCVLYHLLVGQPPFIAEGAGQIIGMHLFQTPAPLLSLNPKLPPPVAELVHKLLTKEKQSRPSMSETTDALGRLLASMPGAAPVVRSRPIGHNDPDATKPLLNAALPSTLGQSVGQSTQRSGIRRQLAVITAFILAGGGFAAWKTRPRPASMQPVSAATAAASPDEPVIRQPPMVPLPVESIRATPARKIHWLITTQPSGATVLDDRGRVMGTTPWGEEHATAIGSTTLRLRKEGFVDAELKLDRAADVAQQVTLTRIKAPAAPEKPKPSPAPSPKLAAPPSQKRNELPYEP